MPMIRVRFLRARMGTAFPILFLSWARSAHTSTSHSRRLAWNSPKPVWRPGSARTRWGSWGSLSAPPDPLAAMSFSIVQYMCSYTLSFNYTLWLCVCFVLILCCESLKTYWQMWRKLCVASHSLMCLIYKYNNISILLVYQCTSCDIYLSFFFSFIHFLFSCGLSTHNKHDDDDDEEYNPWSFTWW